MTLVSVLGDFHSSILPVYYQLRNQIKTHIIIYNDFKCDVNEVRDIITGINKFNKKYYLDIETHSYCMKENSYEVLNDTIEYIKDNTEDLNELIINTTDGPSNFNIIIGFKLLPLGAQLLSYDRYDNEANVINTQTMQTYKLDDVIPIKDHFLLKNIHVERVASKSFAKRNKKGIISLFEDHYEEFKSFSRYIQKTNSPTLKNKTYKHVNKIIKKFKIKNLKSEQSLITGSLFEYYIYLKLKKLNYDDIELGVFVKKYIDEKNFIPNEFDILIMKDNHLHMIECKFTKNIKLDHLVYKYMGLKSLLDDDGKICIITSHKEPKDVKTNKNPVKYQPYKRARANDILLKGNPVRKIKKFIFEVKEFFDL